VQRLHPEMKNTDDEFDDFELRVEFNQERGVVKGVRSQHEIATMSSKYRYFEVEVVENDQNSEIYVGIVDSRESVTDQIAMWADKKELDEEQKDRESATNKV
jgi:hypothetical protein